jgi:hypothetical protein
LRPIRDRYNEDEPNNNEEDLNPIVKAAIDPNYETVDSKLSSADKKFKPVAKRLPSL